MPRELLRDASGGGVGLAIGRESSADVACRYKTRRQSRCPYVNKNNLTPHRDPRDGDRVRRGERRGVGGEVAEEGGGVGVRGGGGCGAG